jgi:asparagine synthase (glutamine-hydrolysing)
MVNEFTPKQTTISYGYFGEHSELKFAEEIAQKYNTRHIEIKENRGEIAHDIQQISKYFDEPFADMSYTPQYKICEAARKHLTVVLAGDVGDELFGGYSFYKVENEMKNHFSYNNLVTKFGLGLYQKLKPTSFITSQNLKYKNILDFHQNQVRNFLSLEEKKSIGISQSYQQPYSFTPNPNSLNDLMRIDLEKYVPGNMLVKSDRMAMANSLEVRTPFLDKDFAEFCISLPDSLKLNSEHDKIILREAMQSYWTETIRNRGKQGFGSSVENWFEQKSLLNLSDHLLKDKSQKVFDFIDFNKIQHLLNKDKKHWNLLQLALWAENNL